MTEKEKFWECYDRIAPTMQDFSKKMEIKYGEEQAKEMRIEKEDAMRKRASSYKWVAYELMQAIYEAMDDPIEKVKKLAGFSHLNEHDAYLTTVEFVKKDYHKFMAKKDAIYNNYKTHEDYIKEVPEDEEDEQQIGRIIAQCEDYHDLLVSEYQALQDELEESLLDHEAYKKYWIQIFPDGSAMLWIERYQETDKKTCLCTGYAPVEFAARFILGRPELEKQLDERNRKLAKEMVTLPRMKRQTYY